ncbi:hypothetical protein F4778DRAFT_732287 [Xylariomycetidae sp. FL2044]|nr:hypothetical protein F4778DRAFT_732287 [Xylariomycetidae sp. FL2044]
MRSFAALAAAPILANVALAQDNLHTTVLTIGFTDSSGVAATATTTYVYEYSNPATALLTQTNSDGIITGVATGDFTQPAVVTSQPDVATIPAGLPEGMTTLVIPYSGSVTSVAVSVGASTTVVEGGSVATATGDSASPSATGSSSSDDDSSSSSDSATGTDSSDSATGTDASPSSTETPGAAAGVIPASFGLASLGAIFAFLL